MMLEERNLMLSDSNLYRSNMLKNVYNNFPSYDEFDGKCVIKMAHCGCSQYGDYALFTDGLYIYTDDKLHPIIKLKDDELNLINIYDFIVTKSGYGYSHKDDLVVTGFSIDSDGKYTLVIIFARVFLNQNDFKTPVIEITDIFKLPLHVMQDNSDEDEPEYVFGMQSSYNHIYIATNYRFVVISEEFTDQYDKVLKMHELVYPSDMIRPNAMAHGTTDDVILYYKNDIIPIYYKFIGIDSDMHWHSFVDQKEYRIVDAITFNNSLIVYGDDAKIHIIDNIHEKNPSADDFIIHAGHSWVGRAFYDTGNIFMKCTTVGTDTQVRIDFMYSVNGINFDRYYSEMIPQSSEAESIQTIVNSSVYMAHGSIIIYNDLYPRFDMIKLQVDMRNFEYTEEYKNVKVLSMSSNSDQSIWNILTDIDVPLNLKRVDLDISSNKDTKNNSKVPIMVEYHDFIGYENYEVIYDDKSNRYLLLIILKSTELPDVNDLCINISFSCDV